MKTKKFKNVVYWTCAVLLIGWVVFRFAAIGAENSRAVFNTARYSADEGAPVFATSVHKESGVLKEPIAVKNNTALVSTYRIDKLKAGQRVGKGKIISVSKDVDLNGRNAPCPSVDVPSGYTITLIRFSRDCFISCSVFSEATLFFRLTQIGLLVPNIQPITG